MVRYINDMKEDIENIRITGTFGYINTAEIKLHSIYKNICNFETEVTLKNFYYLTHIFADNIFDE